MPLASWTQYLDASLAVTLETTSPLKGTKSLRFANTAAEQNGNLFGTASIAKGYAVGKVRSLIKLNASSGVFFGGLYCFASQEDLRYSGNAYLIGADRTLAQNRFRLWRTTGGIENKGTELATTGTAQWTDNVMFTLEVEFRYSVLWHDGTLIIVRKGTLSDYSDLATVLSYFDTSSSKLTTSIGEGPWVQVTTAGGFVGHFDGTEIYEGALSE